MQHNYYPMSAGLITTAQLSGSTDVGTGVWGTTSEASVNSSTGVVGNMVAGNCYIFTYTVTNGTCDDSEDVQVCVDAEPDANAGTDQRLCNILTRQ